MNLDAPPSRAAPPPKTDAGELEGSAGVAEVEGEEGRQRKQRKPRGDGDVDRERRKHKKKKTHKKKEGGAEGKTKKKKRPQQQADAVDEGAPPGFVDVNETRAPAVVVADVPSPEPTPMQSISPAAAASSSTFTTSSSTLTTSSSTFTTNSLPALTPHSTGPNDRVGYLNKKGHVRRNWNIRWFKVEPGRLSYWKNPETAKLKGEVRLDSETVVDYAKEVKKPHAFVISRTAAGGQTSYELFVSANNALDMNDWMKAINDSKVF